jgi:hypothetical protein
MTTDELTQARAAELAHDAAARIAVLRASELSDPAGSNWPEATVTVTVEDIAGPFGAYMPAWPEQDATLYVVHCQPGWGTYLDLLEESYAEVSPEAALLVATEEGRRERVAVGVMNDVLQVQLTAMEPPGYSMVLHHALMLFAATTWLPADRVDRWRATYDELAASVFGAGAVILGDYSDVIAEVEAEGMKSMALMAGGDNDAEVAAAARRYLVMAGAAIGVVFRQWDRMGWTWPAAIGPLLRSYRSPRCLLDPWP